MSVSHNDVRRIAELARIAVPEERLESLSKELNGILEHMESLTDVASAGAVNESQGMRLAPDVGPSVHLERRPADFAPNSRDGFFLVPRLSTHDSAADAS